MEIEVMGRYSRSRSRSRSPAGRDRRKRGRSVSPPRRRDHRRRRSSTPPRELPHIRGGPRQEQVQHLPALYSVHRATVRAAKAFGLFVELQGHRRQGLVHSTAISSDVSFSKEDDEASRAKALDFLYPPGTEVWIKVTKVDEAQQKFGCSMQAVSQETGQDLDPSNQSGGEGPRGPQQEGAPEQGAILASKVHTIKPFGVFVQMQGWRTNGLVHVRQVSNFMDFGKDDSDEEKVAALRSVVAEGDPCFVKVLDVRLDEASGRTRISCSMKLVSQRDGEDLDPNWVTYKKDAPTGGRPSSGPTGNDIGALDTGGQVKWGHLAAADPSFGGTEGKYDLVEEFLPGPPPRPQHMQGVGHGPEASTPGASGKFNSVEEAQAYLAAHAKHDGKKSKKDKKDKDKKKGKHKHDKKTKHKSK